MVLVRPTYCSRHPFDHGVAGREIKHNCVVILDFPESGKPLVRPLDPFKVGISPDQWHGIGREREGQRRIGQSWSVGDLANIEMVSHQQGFFHGGGRDLVILEQENIDQGNSDHGEYQCIQPFNPHTVLFFTAFPERPVDLLADIDVEDHDQTEQPPEISQPDDPQDIDKRCKAESDVLVAYDFPDL